MIVPASHKLFFVLVKLDTLSVIIQVVGYLKKEFPTICIVTLSIVSRVLSTLKKFQYSYNRSLNMHHM